MLIKNILRNDPVQRSVSRARKKFLHYFPKGFREEKYIAWERQYKLDAHLQFRQELDRDTYLKLLNASQYEKIAAIAVRIESKTNLLF